MVEVEVDVVDDVVEVVRVPSELKKTEGMTSLGEWTLSLTEYMRIVPPFELQVIPPMGYSEDGRPVARVSPDP